MRFHGDDELLTMDVVCDEADLFVVTEGGFAKRTALSEYRVQGRGGLGVKVANLVEQRGNLVGALVTQDDSEVLVIMEGGKIVRSKVGEVSRTGRNTQGVIFSRADQGDRVRAVTLNVDNDTVDNDTADSDAVDGGAVDSGVADGDTADGGAVDSSQLAGSQLATPDAATEVSGSTGESDSSVVEL